MHTTSSGHARLLSQSQSSFGRGNSVLRHKSSKLQRRNNNRMQLLNYLSPSGLATAGAVALVSLVTWGVSRLNGTSERTGSTSNGVNDGGRPEVLCADNAFNREVLGRCGTINSGYRRFWGVWGRHMETIWGAVLRRNPGVKYKRELLERPDGGTVALDYYDPEGKPALPANSPIVILMPGLAGGSGCTYVQYSAQRAYQFGFRAIVFNSRGTGGSMLTSPQFYSASFTEDTRGVIKHITKNFPESTLMCIGWSLGGNILVNYLGEEGCKTPVTAAVSLCNPFNLVECDKELKVGFSTMYDRNLGRGMSELFKPNAHFFKDKPKFNTAMALNCRSVRDFDIAITHVSFGWKNVDEYYEKSGSHLSIPHVKIPLLCIQALDDPIAVERAIPREAIQNNPHCVLVGTPSGGHLGWVAGEGAPFKAPWSDLASMEWLESVLMQLAEIEKGREPSLDNLQDRGRKKKVAGKVF